MEDENERNTYMKIIKNQWPNLYQKLDDLKTNLPIATEKWTKKSVNELDQLYRDHLGKQGRGGQPPPLSNATHIIYTHIGEPDGSGILNHIEIKYETTTTSTIAIFGIPEGQPTIIAKVQDQGALIAVTPRMRAFLASCGIYLKASTTHIDIPGRQSWELSTKTAQTEAMRSLKILWNQLIK